MRDDEILTGAILEDSCLTLDQLAGACAVSPDWVRVHVEEGLLMNQDGDGNGEWRFTRRELWRARHLHRLERDFDASPELAALVADLLEELESLRARLQRAGLR
ncbi:MAG TPA: chaperone modulator CbpM [Candidatus Competibacter sp.]|nr:MerR family transcriptional regulator [Candidatus Competibacteraceae bacterium]HRE55563.1 chaperone modulator CbpM [Candidatus Competibacter sp.]HUM95754.1 chaperone modulator CbpM [Candidatus Competibacter sp.]